jgi:AraC family transcriptional regulator, melibiose operon regulatory protein
LDFEDLIHEFIKRIELSIFIRDSWIKHLEPGNHTLFHTRRTTTIIFIEHGSGIFKINNTSVKASNNDCLLLFQDESLTFTFNNAQSCTLLSLQLDFHNFASLDLHQGVYTFVKPYFMSSMNSSDNDIKDFLKLKKYNELQNIIRKIILEINSKLQKYEIFIKLLCCELLLSIARAVEIENSENINTANQYVNAAIYFIESEISHDLTPEFIAKSVHLSIDYLHHLFKKNTGYSLMEYVSTKRIEVSKRLLDSSKDKVSEIAEKVGLEPQYFSTLFKKHTSFSPNEYRNRFESDQIISDIEYSIKVNCGCETDNNLPKDQEYKKGDWGYTGNTFTHSTENTQFPDFGFSSELNSLRFGGVFKYIFNVPNGFYRVELFFSELYWTTIGKRIFTVKVKNKTAIENFDILKEAGGQNKVAHKYFTDIYISDGILMIEFISIEDFAQINMIIIEKIKK